MPTLSKQNIATFKIAAKNLTGAKRRAFEARCGPAMLHKLAGVNPAQVIASHEPGIEPCRHSGNDMLDA